MIVKVYNLIISDPGYSIVAILAMLVILFLILKKLFKFVIYIFILFLIFLVCIYNFDIKVINNVIPSNILIISNYINK